MSNQPDENKRQIFLRERRTIEESRDFLMRRRDLFISGKSEIKEQVLGSEYRTVIDTYSCIAHLTAILEGLLESSHKAIQAEDSRELLKLIKLINMRLSMLMDSSTMLGDLRELQKEQVNNLQKKMDAYTQELKTRYKKQPGEDEPTEEQ